MDIWAEVMNKKILLISSIAVLGIHIGHRRESVFKCRLSVMSLCPIDFHADSSEVLNSVNKHIEGKD
jgi:hypothetical protein